MKTREEIEKGFASGSPLHRLFHVLWTKAVGTSDYVKREWTDFERTLSHAFSQHADVVEELQRENERLLWLKEEAERYWKIACGERDALAEKVRELEADRDEPWGAPWCDHPRACSPSGKPDDCKWCADLSAADARTLGWMKQWESSKSDQVKELEALLSRNAAYRLEWEQWADELVATFDPVEDGGVWATKLVRSKIAEKLASERAVRERAGYEICTVCNLPQWVQHNGDHECMSYRDARYRLERAEGALRKAIEVDEASTRRPSLEVIESIPWVHNEVMQILRAALATPADEGKS